MDQSQRPTTKPYRYNARLNEDEMDQVQAIMNDLGLSKTEVLTYLLEVHEHALKIIRDSK